MGVIIMKPETLLALKSRLNLTMDSGRDIILA